MGGGQAGESAGSKGREAWEAEAAGQGLEGTAGSASVERWARMGQAEKTQAPGQGQTGRVRDPSCCPGAGGQEWKMGRRWLRLLHGDCGAQGFQFDPTSEGALIRSLIY